MQNKSIWQITRLKHCNIYSYNNEKYKSSLLHASENGY